MGGVPDHETTACSQSFPRGHSPVSPGLMLLYQRPVENFRKRKALAQAVLPTEVTS